MLNKITKPLAIVSAAALMLSVSTVSLAAGSGNGAQKKSANTQTCQVKPSNSHESQGAGKGTKSAEGQSSNGLQGNSNQMKNMAKNAASCGVNCNAMDESIAALSKDDANTLSQYINAYENAVDALEAAKEDAEEGKDLSSYNDTVRTSFQALIDAAKVAEIELAPALGNQIGQSNKDEKVNNGMHFGAISNVISSLSEDDADTLSDYISAYQNAVTAMKNASDYADKDQDLSAYRNAVKTALQALFGAAEDKGIELTPSFYGQVGNIDGKSGQPMSCSDVLAAIDALSEDDTVTLSDYISDYEDAVTAMKNASDGADEDDDLSSYRQDVQTALQALLDAAEGQGIELLSTSVE